jgi:O-antigen/teichoic acid export membrane protein
MAVALYTSRVVLDKLGVEDYGIYNIAGSVVVSLAFVRNSLASAIRRFLSYEKAQSGNCSSMFSMGMNVQLVIMIASCLLLETIGLYFFTNVLKIPEERQYVAAIVYHISVITFCANLIKVPFDALIISNEKMSVYAYISILEVVMKLVIVYALTVTAFDRLVLYASLILLVDLLIIATLAFYCKRCMREDCQYIFIWDRKKFKEFFAFSFWNLVGGLAGVGSKEGPNYFINYFLGVRVNAAMGVAKQVSNMVYHFSANFQSAFNPQIVKSYAAGEKDYMVSLIFRTAKLSFFLMFVMTVPIILCIDDILNVWLTVVPEYTQVFCVCFLLAELISAVSSPFWMAAHAIGNIRNYQLSICGFNLSVIPVSWLVLNMGWNPYWIFIYLIVINACILIYRLGYLKNKMGFPAKRFLSEVLLRLFVIIPVLTIPILLFFSQLFNGISKILIIGTLSVVSISVCFLYFGLSSNEREWVFSIIRKKVGKK